MTNESRLRNLFTYLERLTALEGVGFTSKREVTECIMAIRGELALEMHVKVQRSTGWNIVQASKVEGASFDEVTTFHIPVNAPIDAEIEKLRKHGFRFFYVYKDVGVVDDVLRAKSYADIDSIASQLAKRLEDEAARGGAQ